ncbi:hypothetical protein CKAN_02703000 [Cinnamomum micranthum f. kanehirae]|uniref:Uncharacterized protein n=1 Tax=Cinnamomum micranthum f. kanehirae TaxID=337451 RepID=A0A3S3RBZ5_9MAGN|nr:hypothetical protein CKAN_02703000 [Cinnamomum micranthum f. kanehirae]
MRAISAFHVPLLLRWKVAVVPSHLYRFLLYLLTPPFLLL